MSLAGLVLAAGYSRRFGSDKRLAKFDEAHTLLQKSLSLIEPYCSLIVVVLRPDDKNHLAMLLGEWLNDPRLVLVYAKDAEKGMGNSLANGVTDFLAIAGKNTENYSGLLVMLGDMPYITANTLQKTVAAHLSDKVTYPCIIRAPAETGWGHPVIFGNQWFSALTLLQGDKGGRSIIADNFAARCEVTVDDENILRDVDRPSDIL